MKTKFLLSFLVVILLSISSYAHDLEVVIFSNIENTENGCTKEFLFCDKDTNAPLNKTVYFYDVAGRMKEKTMYEWDENKGWIGTQKFEYNYDQNNQPQIPIVKKWNKKSNNWM